MHLSTSAFGFVSGAVQAGCVATREPDDHMEVQVRGPSQEASCMRPAERSREASRPRTWLFGAGSMRPIVGLSWYEALGVRRVDCRRFPLL